MAKKEVEINRAEIFSIEDLKLRRATPEAVYQGVKALMKWKSGKQLTEEEYIKAVEKFEASAAGRR
ncbi:MAG: hypothetical protein ACI4LO_01960 [Anaerovoracaceae bacterium]